MEGEKSEALVKGRGALYRVRSASRYTPFTLAKKLGAIALLESASYANGKERYSLLMCEKAFDITQDGDEVLFTIDARTVTADFEALLGRSTVPSPLYTKRGARKCDIVDALVYVSKQNESALSLSAEDAALPIPASGIGRLGYEFCARADSITLSSQVDTLHISESHFIVGHIYIIVDHFTQKMHIFAFNYNEHQIDLKKALDAIDSKLDNLDFSYLEAPPPPAPATRLTRADESKREYCEKVELLKKEIIEGNIMQAVPSRRLQIESADSALEVYRRLRETNPSPYLFFLDFGDYQMVGASPESLVRVRAGFATIRPIAGTRRRGKDKIEDAALKKELLADPKEKAEHLMLVDLARNDLGRVCKAGSVKVERFMDVQFFRSVMHITSEVSGEVLPNIPTTDVLRSAFPAGTVSGSPKIAAIELLSKLETQKRRFYAGAVGYLASSGDLDFCIALRCALKQGDIWTLQAGGGIVYDSNAEREWTETCEKLSAMEKALLGE